MDIVERILAGFAIALLLVMSIGWTIEKTAIEGYQQKGKFHKGKQNEK